MMAEPHDPVLIRVCKDLLFLTCQLSRMLGMVVPVPTCIKAQAGMVHPVHTYRPVPVAHRNREHHLLLQLFLHRKV